MREKALGNIFLAFQKKMLKIMKKKRRRERKKELFAFFSLFQLNSFRLLDRIFFHIWNNQHVSNHLDCGVEKKNLKITWKTRLKRINNAKREFSLFSVWISLEKKRVGGDDCIALCASETNKKQKNCRIRKLCWIHVSTSHHNQREESFIEFTNSKFFHHVFMSNVQCSAKNFPE